MKDDNMPIDSSKSEALMRGFAEEKIPGGKLLRVKVDLDSCIKNVQISGDFFVHPEEAVSKLEERIAGMKADVGESQLILSIEEFSKSNDVKMIGISPADIARVLKKAIDNAR